jgi:hypothetical protein
MFFLDIRKTIESDLTDISHIHAQAFGEDKGPEIAALVLGLLDDQTAMPLLSLVAAQRSWRR